MRSVPFFVTLLAATALAQGKPTLVDYPLDVKAPLPPAQHDELQSEFRMLLAKNPAVLLSTKTQWKASVSALKRQDCDVRDECLQQLAVSAGTLYALYASVSQNAAGTEVTATGRVVNQDRVQVRAPLSFSAPRKPKGSFNDAAREALGKLVAALELDKLSATLTSPIADPVVAVAPPPAQPKNELLLPPPPPLPPPEAVVTAQKDQGASSLRPVAWIFGGLGVAAAGVAVGFGVSAASARATLPVDGRFDETQARTQAAVNRDASVALGSSLGAAALLGTATVLFIASAPSTPKLSLAPAPGGARVTLTGEF